MPLIATKGAASVQGFGEFAQSAAVNYIEDVFQTWLYTGNSSTQTITNNIDLSTKGGMVWLKNRGSTSDNGIYDTTRGANNVIYTNLTNAQSTLANSLTAFGTTGFTLGTDSTYNFSADTLVSWTFRKQPKFFDIVSFTGPTTGNTITVNHNLGSVPGCIIYKSSANSSNWYVWHRSLADEDYLKLESSAAASDNNYSIAATSTTFSLRAGFNISANLGSCIAYLFAHDAGGFGASGSDNVISCGGYTGTGAAGNAISLGYEPQWILIKRTDSTGNWLLFDTMRGWPVGDARELYPNLNAAEDTSSYNPSPTATGFTLRNADSRTNGSGATYIYIAIRRGPMKTPTTGTSVFYPNAVPQGDTRDSTGVPFPPDLVTTFSRDGTNRTASYDQFQFVDRLRGFGSPPNNTFTVTGGPALISSSTAAEGAGQSYVQLKANSRDITASNGWNSTLYGNWIYYFMQRAPGFFDEVCYTGTGSSMTLSHNLAVSPELIILKERNASGGWIVYSSPTGFSVGGNLAGNGAFSSGLAYVSATSSTTFTTLTNASTYVAYLFATVAGVSKVGSYTGTGSTQTINCGFTAGSRFVMIKRTDSTGDWYVWDSARGIVAGNDPYLLLNTTDAEVTNTDYVDTANSGFEISSTAPAAINANGGTFIFLAIA